MWHFHVIDFTNPNYRYTYYSFQNTISVFASVGYNILTTKAICDSVLRVFSSLGALTTWGCEGGLINYVLIYSKYYNYFGSINIPEVFLY